MDSGRPKLTPDILARFKRYHADHPAWGCLHIVLDDFNLDTGSVEFCRKYSIENNDDEAAQLADVLLSLSKTQRGRIAREA